MREQKNRERGVMATMYLIMCAVLASFSAISVAVTWALVQILKFLKRIFGLDDEKD
jgi:hypothetical protein